MKNVVVGANGLLGSAFVRKLIERGEDVLTMGWGEDNDYYFDLDTPEVADSIFMGYRPDRVFLCAYNSHVDWSENNSVSAQNRNVFGNWYLSLLANRLGAKVFFPSSSYVFDGKREVPYLYTEEDEVSPINLYGEHKRHLEESLLFLGNALVFRTVGIFGNEEKERNFFFQVLKHVQDRTEMRVPDDQHMNPIWSDNLAQAVLDLDDIGFNGLIHIAGDRGMSKYRWAWKIAQMTLDDELIIPVKSSELDQLAERPKNAVLGCQKFIDLMGYVPEMGMREFLNGLYLSS